MKQGDKVYISPLSTYYRETAISNPTHTIGTITKVNPSSTFMYDVIWNNTKTNVYEPEDLILAPINNTISKKYIRDIYEYCGVPLPEELDLTRNTITKKHLYNCIIQTKGMKPFLNLHETFVNHGFDIKALQTT